MNNIRIFNFEDSKNAVRTVNRDGEVFFVAKDVAKVLCYANTNEAIKSHCRGEIDFYHPLPTIGGQHDARIINQYDLISLIMHSKFPKAIAFGKWVVEEVIPQVLETGLYQTDMTEDEMTLLVITNLQKKIEVMKEKACTSTICIRSKQSCIKAL